MAVSIKDVTVISLSAVGTNLVTNLFPTSIKNTVRVVEIVGGLVAAQFAKSSVSKDIGVGVFMGTIINFVNGVFNVSGTSYPVEYNTNFRNTNNCPNCNQNK